jgi:NAD(P)-dependent dehydrogenase (short-subunit alcohol dehydrogenase family)
MDLGLKGKVALVTGASQGIGWAIASRLAEEGMELAVAARNQERLQALAASVEQRGGRCLVHVADLSVPTAASTLVTAVLKRYGRIDLVVNNAGATARGDFLTLTDAQWNDGFALKFFAAMRISRAAWPALAAAHGSIVNIAGVGGRTGSAEFTIGGSVNAAMLNLTKALADRGVKDGVRVNAVNPGFIRTERLGKRIERVATERGLSLAEAEAAVTTESGLARFGQPEEIAAAVAFLAGAQAGYIQGSIWDIDGGLTRTL